MSLRMLRAPDRSRETFLMALSHGKTVRQACEEANLGRSTVYDWRAEDPDFAAAWHDALETGTDRLEEAALVRAVEGVTTRRTMKNGEVEEEVITYSDRLLELMLKARRPRLYRDRVDIRSTNVNVSAGELRAIREAAAAHPEAFEELARALVAPVDGEVLGELPPEAGHAPS